MEPLVSRAGEGEVVSSGERRDVRIRAAHERLVLTESRYAPGESGPGPHVHHLHADCMWVLEGELLFELGPEGERVRVPAGGWILVPPDVVHTFRNEGPADARFLNVHAPGMGFDDHLRALRDGDEDASARFDSDDPPADGGRPASEAVVRAPGEGERIAMGPSSATFKAEGGTLSLTETVLAPGFPGPVPHHHEGLVDSFYVLEGTLALRLGGEEARAGPGTYALVPPGAVHTFSNPAGEPARVLNLMAPGGFEQYLKEVAALMRPGEPPDPAAMAEVAARYDFHPAG